MEDDAGDVEGDWTHDKFSGGRRRGGFGGGLRSAVAAAPAPAPPAPRAPIQLGARVMVTNLDKGVGADDLREIFSRVGIVKAVAIHYADDGSSKGVADVTYRARAAAEAAVVEFDGRQVDDTIIRVRIVGEASAPAPAAAIPAPAGDGFLERRGRGAFEAAAATVGPGPAYYAPAPAPVHQSFQRAERPARQFSLGAPRSDSRGGRGGGRGGRGRGGGGFLGGRGGHVAPSSEGDLDAQMEAYRAAATR